MNESIGRGARSSRGQVLAACALALTVLPVVADKAPAAPAGWHRVDNPAPVIGVDGKPHAAACSGLPGTDPSYKFWTRRGKSRNLVVYFEGGGACWDNLTCSFPIEAGLPAALPQFYVPAITPDTNPAGYSGIFDGANPANPVKDWNFVYVPYCSGDVHSGSADRTYYNVGNPVLPLPPAFGIHHGGFDNFMVVLDWMRKNVEEPGQVLVAGSSAGGYGASINFPWVQKVFPKARLSVIADASQGVMSHNFDVGTPGRGSWNPQLAQWVFGKDPALVASRDILATAAEAYPKARVAQFTTAFDAVQIGFYGVTKAYYGPGGVCPNPALDWNQQMLTALQTSKATAPNYRYYLAQGQYHTILRSPQFYTEGSAGVAFKDWVGAMLSKGDGDDAPAAAARWQNAACPGCLVAPTCP